MKLTFNSQFNSYTVNKKVPFIGNDILITHLKKAIDFSFEMCFGKGHHRGTRSGGSHQRKNGEMFCNAFQGKLAEIAVYDYFVNNNISCSELDFSISPEGIWDDADLIYKEKKISIKSVAFFSDLLLLETKDWNSSGQYIPNLSKGLTANYDYFILVRIKPDIKKIFKSKGLYDSNEARKQTIDEVFREYQWQSQIVGYCTHKTIKHIIANEYILPQNSLLNGKAIMDAENYYVQSGDLKKIENLIIELKSI